MTETQFDKEGRYIAFGRALDCLDRLSGGQLRLLKSAIEKEQQERAEQQKEKEGLLEQQKQESLQREPK